MKAVLSFRCAGCQARIKAPFELLGQSRACPGCGYRLYIRLKAPPESGPMLVPDEVRYARAPLRRF
jgi:DNA-directed RNA polymerase subunit RPC12/RpoP